MILCHAVVVVVVVVVVVGRNCFTFSCKLYYIIFYSIF